MINGENNILIPYNQELVASILLSSDRPLMETELLRLLQTYHTGNESLYLRHFSLYHVLYKLACEMGPLGYHFHGDCMRIRLIALPLNGCCHYCPEDGMFCGTEIISAGEGKNIFPYCRFHEEQYLKIWRSVVWDPLRDFYLNEENVSFGETELFRKIREGIMVYAFRKGEIERSLAIFGLERPDRKLVESRYRRLALKHHPDRGGSEKTMAEINSAYNVLCEVFVL